MMVWLVPSDPVIFLKAIYDNCKTRGKTEWLGTVEIRKIDSAVELLKTIGFDGLAEAVTVLPNSAMPAELSEHLSSGTA